MPLLFALWCGNALAHDHAVVALVTGVVSVLLYVDDR